MGKFHSVPMYAQSRHHPGSMRAPRRHRSVDLVSSLAAVAAPVAFTNDNTIPESYNFLAGAAADRPPRYSRREEAAYNAGVAAAIQQQPQQQQWGVGDAAEFMQSLQQAARAQAAAAAEAESAAAAQLHPCAAFPGGAFGASPFLSSPFAADSFAPTHPAMGATAEPVWTYEADGAACSHFEDRLAHVPLKNLIATSFPALCRNTSYFTTCRIESVA